MERRIPKEHLPLFYDAVPDDGRVETIKMFGGVAGMVNGHMFGGLWSDTVVVRLSDDDRRAALALPGAREFDPMEKGRVVRDMALLPQEIMRDPDALRGWLERALAYTATLPPDPRKVEKAQRASAKQESGDPPPRAAAKRPTHAATGEDAPKKTAAKKTAAKKKAAKKKAPAAAKAVEKNAARNTKAAGDKAGKATATKRKRG